MPRVTFVKSARKPNPVAQVGESYYWWKFRFGGKRFSKTYPKQSQLTQSEYLGRLYDMADAINEAEIKDPDEWETFRDDLAGQMQELADEQQEKVSNMEEHGLEYTPTGEQVQERYDACENAANEMESFEPDEIQTWEDQQAEWDQWQDEQPPGEGEQDYDEDEYADWEAQEPQDPEDREAMDLSEFASFVEECHV